MVGGWVDGWIDGGAGLRIAYSNQKLFQLKGCVSYTVGRGGHSILMYSLWLYVWQNCLLAQVNLNFVY